MGHRSKTIGADPMGFITISAGNMIPIGDIAMILTPHTRVSIKMRQHYRAQGKCLDLTRGKKLRSMVLLRSSWYLILCPVEPLTLAGRCEQWFFQTKGGR